VVNSALQISAALGVAVLGGVFYAVASPAYSHQAVASGFIAAMLGIAACLSFAALLCIYASTPPLLNAKPH